MVLYLMTDAAVTSETTVKFYQTTRRYNPEDSHLYRAFFCMSGQAISNSLMLFTSGYANK
jgi:hypothetical protein